MWRYCRVLNHMVKQRQLLVNKHAANYGLSCHEAEMKYIEVRLVSISVETSSVDLLVTSILLFTGSHGAARVWHTLPYSDKGMSLSHGQTTLLLPALSAPARSLRSCPLSLLLPALSAPSVYSEIMSVCR